MIAGIDLSTRCIDVCLLNDDLAPTFTRYQLPGPGDSFDRARQVRTYMPTRGWWEDHGVIAAGIEDPRGYAAGHIYRIQGGILQTLPLGLLVVPWIPSEWRRVVGLPGNAPKAVVALWAVEQGCPEGLPQDAYDAYAIACATERRLERSKAA